MFKVQIIISCLVLAQKTDEKYAIKCQLENRKAEPNLGDFDVGGRI
jgi:hypothetical protein